MRASHGARQAAARADLRVSDEPYYLWMDAPSGAPLRAVLLGMSSDGALVEVCLQPRRPRGPGPRHPAAIGPALREATYQLRAYLSGRLRCFTLPWRIPEGSSTFRRDVLHAVAEIPFGETLSYGEVSALAGHPGAARAVGGVMAKNPLPLVIPCHRVLAAQGGLGGFSGGLATKRALLAHEGLTGLGPRRI